MIMEFIADAETLSRRLRKSWTASALRIAAQYVI
jgi:hypothetical protein